MKSIIFINKKSMVETCGAPYGIFKKYRGYDTYWVYVGVAGINEGLTIIKDACEEEIPVIINIINKEIKSGKKVIDCDNVAKKLRHLKLKDV